MFSIRKINKKFVRSARSKHSSILMAAYSIGIQIINFSLLPLAVFIHESVLISALIKIMAMLCFFTLLFGILGIVYGFMYLLYCDISISPIIGILLNSILLIFFALVYFTFVIVGVSV